ncbi:MAG: hypothetical protein K5883_08660 [Pseudobutyrivibrio sp.]|nr:hypothetical protein [Pseudobutyrivibrio sp.]
MDALSMNSYLQNQYADRTKQVADSTAKSISGISSDSSREEIEGAVKGFETFMMEQVIKEVKKSFVSEEEKNDNISMYKDLYMDKAISEIATQLVDQIGGDVTDDFVDQIMRNYGITGTSASAAASSPNTDDTSISDDIAETNATTVTSVQA